MRKRRPTKAETSLLAWVWMAHELDQSLPQSCSPKPVSCLDALKYADGPRVYRVRFHGRLAERNDEFEVVAMTPLWSVDATSILDRFSRWCALRVMHLDRFVPSIRRYLVTGNKALKYAKDKEWLSEVCQLEPYTSAPSVAYMTYRDRAVWENAWDAAKLASFTLYEEKHPECVPQPWDPRISGKIWDDLDAELVRLVEAAHKGHPFDDEISLRELSKEVQVILREDAKRPQPTPPPSPRKKVEPIRVWKFEDAPEEYRRLSQGGGDEDWLAVVPSSLAKEWIGWMESGTPFGGSKVDEYWLPDQTVVRVGRHC